jgi:hypothetical protein
MILAKRDVFILLRATCVRARDLILLDVNAATTLSALQLIMAGILTDVRWQGIV